MDSSGPVDTLLRKAEGDERALRKMAGDPEIPAHIIGFLAQQVIEKRIKAVLTFRRIEFRYTHDLVELFRQLDLNGISFPAGLREADRLVPYASDFRYDDGPGDDTDGLDRGKVLEWVSVSAVWVSGQIPATGD